MHIFTHQLMEAQVFRCFRQRHDSPQYAQNYNHRKREVPDQRVRDARPEDAALAAEVAVALTK